MGLYLYKKAVLLVGGRSLLTKNSERCFSGNLSVANVTLRRQLAEEPEGLVAATLFGSMGYASTTSEGYCLVKDWYWSADA